METPMSSLTSIPELPAGSAPDFAGYFPGRPQRDRSSSKNRAKSCADRAKIMGVHQMNPKTMGFQMVSIKSHGLILKDWVASLIGNL